MTRKILIGLLAAIAASMCAALIGCGSSKSPKVESSKPADTAAQKRVGAALASLDTTSVSFSTAIVGKIEGKSQQSGKMVGSFDPKTQRGILTTSGSKNQADDIRAIVTSDATFLSRTGKDNWVKITNKDAFELISGPALVDLAKDDALRASLTGLRVYPAATVNGQKATKYSVAVKNDTTSSSTLGLPPLTDVLIWLNQSGQAVRVEAKYKIDNTSGGLFSTLTGVQGKGTLDVTVDRSDIGKGVNPKAPAHVVKETNSLSEATQFLLQSK